MTARSAAGPMVPAEASLLLVLEDRTGATALVVDAYAGQVTPVDTATGHVYPAITVGGFPVAAAITS